MKILPRTLLPVLLCTAMVPSTTQAKWSLFSKLKCRNACNAASACPPPCASESFSPCEPVGCDTVCGAPIVDPIVTDCCGITTDEVIMADAYTGESIVESYPIETVYHEGDFGQNEFDQNAAHSVAPIEPIAMEQAVPSEIGSAAVVATPAVGPTPIEPVADADVSEPQVSEAALAKAEAALKKARAETRKAKAALAKAQAESEAALAAAKAASQEQLAKLKTQNANLKKNLETARKRIERMQTAPGQQAKREEEPAAKAASDSKVNDKKPGNRKPANKKKADESAANKKPAEKAGKKASAQKANSEKE